MVPENEREDLTLAGRDLTAGRLTARIAMLIGGEQALPVFQECLTEAGLTEINSSQDMLHFARALARRGAKLEELSRTLSREVMDAVMRQAKKKLISAIGAERTNQVIKDCLSEANLTTVTNPQELLNFALCLIGREGVIKVIGHSLKIQALLDGATQNPTK